MRYVCRTFLVLSILLVVGCQEAANWLVLNDNFYWSAQVGVDKDPTTKSHILLVIDDSGSVATIQKKLAKSLPGLLDKLDKENINYFIHMALMSELDTNLLETQGIIELPETLVSGEKEVRTILSNLKIDSNFSKEYGVHTLVGALQKLFPRVSDIKSVGQLTPTRYDGPLPTSEQIKLLRDYFSVDHELNLAPLGVEEIFPVAQNVLLNNLGAITENYDYYLYHYLQDQLTGARTYAQILFVSDEDQQQHEDVSRVSLGRELFSDGDEKYIYEYKRSFVQSSHLQARDLCIPQGNPRNFNLFGRAGYHYNSMAAPSTTTTWSCDSGHSVSQSNWNTANNGSYRTCLVPKAWDCRPLTADGNVGDPVRITNQHPFSLWQKFYANSSGGRVGYTDILVEGGRFAAFVPEAKWDEPTAANKSITYNEVCVPFGNETVVHSVPHDRNRPLQNIPGVEDCRNTVCTRYSYPGTEAEVTSDTVSARQVSCPDSTYERRVGSSVGWSAVPGSRFDAKTHSVQSLPSNVRVEHYLVYVTGTIESDSPLTDAEVATRIRAKAAGPYPGFLSGEAYAGVKYLSSYQEEAIEITRRPKSPEERNLFGLNGFENWSLDAFEDLKMTVSAIVKTDTLECPDQVGISGQTEVGQTYIDLANLTGGLVKNICELGSDNDFDAFMELMKNNIVANTLQSVPLQGPREDGVLEVKDLSAGGTLLEEGVHWRFEKGGKYGYVVFLKGRITAGHQIQVAVTR